MKRLIPLLILFLGGLCLSTRGAKLPWCRTKALTANGDYSARIAEQLRDRAAAKKPFLIAITGHGTIGDRRRSAEVGIHLHLVKPVDPSMLAKVLERFQRAVSTLQTV